MASTHTTSQSASSSVFEALFSEALAQYTQQTGKNLLDCPLASKIDTCDSAESLLSIFQEQAQQFQNVRNADPNLILRLRSMLNDLHTLSAWTSPVFPFVKLNFYAISILLSTAKSVDAIYDPLVDTFERVEIFLRRLAIYTEIEPTPAMAEIIVKMMAKLLSVLAFATKQITQGRLKKYVKKLLGRNDMEAVLQRLDRITAEESKMTVPENLNVIYGLSTSTQLVRDDGNAPTGGIRQSLDLVHERIMNVNKPECDRLHPDVLRWLSPPDPSINHNIARDAYLDGTAVWFTQGDMFQEWKTTGSLLWIHGISGSGKTVLCSTIIEDVRRICETGSATCAFYYCDFRDIAKQNARGLLSSLIFQLSDQSNDFSILSELYLSHDRGSQPPPHNDVLMECLKKMLGLPGQGPVYLIIDALDECLPTARGQVLLIMLELINLKLPHVHFCIASRPEIYIREVLEPLAIHNVALHEQPGHNQDIADYVRSIVHSDRNMQKWRREDQELVISTLTAKSDGMFRWAFCQLEVLGHCLPPSVRRVLNELPETLDETYEQTLLDINKGQWANAYRIFQCLVVSFRPLRVEEVAELSASRTATETRPIGWRPGDAVEFVLSACSTLVTSVNVDGNKVVQFSHFSVREYLMSDRIATSGPVSYFHIPPILAHTFLTGVCLNAALQIDDQFDGPTLKNLPETKHWVDHGQSEDVSSYIEDAMKCFFDTDKPYFAAWTWLCDIEQPPSRSTTHRKLHDATPLYYAALCGFRNIVERLIEKYPQDVNARGGRCATPIHAAVDKRQLNTTRLLLDRGADVDSWGTYHYTPLHLSSHHGYADMVSLLIARGADPDAKNVGQETPLIMASNSGRLETATLLLERGADPNQPDNSGWTPLHVASLNGYEDIVRVLLSCGANPNTKNDIRDTPLHIASFHGQFTIMRLLLERGADVGSRDTQGGTPLHDAAQSGLPDAVQLLLDHGGDINAKNEDGRTALHTATYYGRSEVGNLLLTRGADVNAQDGDGWTALHLTAYRGHVEILKLLLTRGGRWHIQNDEGNTPLQVALEGDDSEMVRLLSKRCW